MRPQGCYLVKFQDEIGGRWVVYGRFFTWQSAMDCALYLADSGLRPFVRRLCKDAPDRAPLSLEA